MGAGFLTAAVTALVWIATYNPLPRKLATRFTVPPIRKTKDCFPSKPATNKRPIPQPIVNAPGGIPIVGNTGHVINPTVNNFGPQQRTVTDEQKEILASFYAGLPKSFHIGIHVPAGEEIAQYGLAIRAALGARRREFVVWSQGMFNSPDQPMPKGVFITTHTGPLYVIAKLCRDLAATQFVVDCGEDDQIKDYEIDVYVGPAP